MNSIQITVEGYDAEHVERQLASLVEHVVRERLDRKVELAIRESIDALVNDSVRARIDAELDAVLVEGWQQTDNYGSPTGKTLNLRDRVSEWLKKTDSWNKSNIVDSKIHEAVARLFDKELNEELRSAKEKLRKEIDEALSGRIVKAVREAVGL